ncbi:MAG: GumC family protein, partial [Bacteroidota bacterium]
MNEDLRNYNGFGQQEEQESIDIRGILSKVIANWYLFVITVGIALAVAFLFNKYSKTVYEVSTTVLVQDDKGSISTQELIGLNINNNKQNLNNEIGLLKSYAMVKRTVKELDFEVSYFTEDNFIVREHYKNPPFKVEFDPSHPQVIGVPFHIRVLDKNHFEINFQATSFSTYDYKNYDIDESISKEYSFNEKYQTGKWIETQYFKFRITRISDENIDEQPKTFFRFNNINSMTNRFRGFTVDPINREASIIKLSITGNNKEKLVEFLNKHTEVYLDRGLERKNQIATNTIEFIDEQLVDIKDSLQISETTLQDFRLENEVMNLEFQAQQLFEKMSELQTQKAQLHVKSRYYEYLKTYVKNNQSGKFDDVIVPSSMGIEDPVLASLVQRLTELYTEKAKLSFSTKQDNVLTGQIDAKIRLTKENILENVNSIISTSQITLKDINQRISEIDSRVAQLPVNQRRLFNIERQFKLLDNIYTFLMQKRSDAQITKASNLPDNEIVDEARVEAASSVHPKQSLNYLIALVLGLLLPVGYIFGKDYLNDKVMDRSDLENNLPDTPMLGHVLHNAKETNLVVH